MSKSQLKGKLSQKYDYEEKVQYLSNERKKVTDIFSFLKGKEMVEFVSLVLLLSLCIKISLAFFDGYLFYTLSLAIAVIAFKYIPDSPVTNVKGNITHFPIIGSTLQLIANGNTMINFVLDTARNCKFEAFDFSGWGIHMYFIFEEQDLKYVLKDNFDNYQKNCPGDFSSFEYVFMEILGRGIFAVDGIEWKDHRKISSHMFSVNGLKSKTQEVFISHGKQLAETLELYADFGTKVNIQEVFQRTVFDAFCEIAFGVHPGSLLAYVENRDSPFQKSFDRMQSIASVRFTVPPLFWLFQRIFNLSTEKELLEHKEIVDSYIQKIITERKTSFKTSENGVDEKNDLLSLYFRHAQKTGQEHLLTDEYLQDTVLNFILAGRDTTSCLLTNWFRLVCLNSEVEKQLSHDYKDLSPSWDDMKHYVYGDAVFNEVLRMYPSVGIDFKIAQEDDVVPSGIPIKKGAKVAIANLIIGRSPKVYSNPEEFKPQRWIEKTSDNEMKLIRNNEYKHPVFLGGPRICIGREMARYEVKVLTKAIMEKLHLKLVDPNQKDDFVTGPVIFQKQGVFCTVERKSE